MSNESKPRKKSGVRHTRAVQRARTTRQNAALPAGHITGRHIEFVHPSTLSQAVALLA